MIIFAIAALFMLLGEVLLLMTYGAQRQDNKSGKPVTSTAASKRQTARSIAYTLIGVGGVIVLGVTALAFLLVGPFF
ncbi:hypothetical protein [Ralstonia sp. 24A2]|uniref:hypothetical protein n=1 Tax=Ralstonia sp. 24A2 TaxID=3447364 RepID=UPI003F69FB15